MKILALLLLLACPASAQWRPVEIGSTTMVGSIEENFRRASLWSNRKLDKYSNDVVYGTTTFNGGIQFADGSIQNTAVAFPYDTVKRELLLKTGSVYYSITVDDNSVLNIDPTATTTTDTLFVQSNPTLYKNWVDSLGVLNNSITLINLGVTKVVLYTATDKLYYVYLNSNGVYEVEYLGQL